VKEDYNFEGLKVVSTALPWPPYLSIVDCQSKSSKHKTNCTNYGLYYNFMNEIKARFNFTFDSILAYEWGVNPVNGSSFDWNGQFVGAKNEVSLYCKTFMSYSQQSREESTKG
jgi:hypothetical protein